MKKNLLLIFVFVFALANAQVDENFDSYTVGSGVAASSSVFDLWTSATATDSLISDTQANSAPNSMHVTNNTTDDMLLLLGDKETGVWYLEWQMYVPTGGTGYWNYQEIEADPGNQFNGQQFVGETASGGTAGQITTDIDAFASAAFPNDAWFLVETVFDFTVTDAATIKITIDGTIMYDGPYGGAKIGSVDFYSIDGSNNVYIDDIRFANSPLSVNDLETVGFNAYPNPVKNVLNLEANENINNVSIFNLIGQQIKNVKLNSLSSSIDLSDLSSGAYFVKVTIGNKVGTIKILK